jgi:hypothetical protein
MPYRPRNQRDLERARHAADAARAQGGSTIDATLAQIGAAFDHASSVNTFKLRVERFLRRGPHDATVRARFGSRAEMLHGRRLDAAMILTERWWRDERKAFQIASGPGPRQPTIAGRSLRASPHSADHALQADAGEFSLHRRGAPQ